MIFITPRLKICTKGLGNEDCFKTWYFYISKTDETRRKRVNSLKTCKLQSQLVIGEVGASCTTFSKYTNSSGGSAVPLWTQFHNIFFKVMYLFVPRTRIPMFKVSWNKTSGQVSLLPNKTRRLRSMWNPASWLLGVTDRKVNHQRIGIHLREIKVW